MALILNIDTALDTAIVNITRNGVILAELKNPDQRDHSAFLHPAIQTLISDIDISIKEIDAIAVSAGPGSYTGLRVGLAAAKGLCYALDKPLLMLGTLEIMAAGALLADGTHQETPHLLYCPMIDARRMEVFTAIYNTELEPVIEPHAEILSEHSFDKCLLKNKICFFGNGAVKWKALCINSNAIFHDVDNNSLGMSRLSFEKFQTGTFADIAYSEPSYIKAFYNGPQSI